MGSWDPRLKTLKLLMFVAGHRQSGVQYLSPVPEHSGTGLGPSNPVPDWFRHHHFFIPVPKGLDVGYSDIPA
jgi:hypothetical protein